MSHAEQLREMRLYGIAVTDKTLLEEMGDRPDALQIQNCLAPQIRRVQEILAPLVRSGQLPHIDVSAGLIGNGRHGIGVEFSATPDTVAGIARAVAEKMPGHKMIDREGTQIMPSAKAAAPKQVRRPPPLQL